MTPKPHEDYVNHPEPPLGGRIKLASGWIPANARRLLDGGCAFGYGTRHFKAKIAGTQGVDPNAGLIEIARHRYPDIPFEVCGLEQTPFESSFFDVIILTEVLEHVIDEKKALNEMCRILAPGGTLIMTTPHRGLFAFMDPDNYAYHLRMSAPGLYRRLYRTKHGKLPPDQIKPGYEQQHRHYSRQDFVRMLDGSDFNGRFEINEVFRSGLFLGVFAQNMYEVLCLLCGLKMAQFLMRPLSWLAEKEYWIPFGPAAYNIAIRLKKIR